MAAVILIAQQLDSMFVTPLVYQQTVNLHPIVTLTAVIVGSAVNNDGDTSGSFGTPGRAGQEDREPAHLASMSGGLAHVAARRSLSAWARWVRMR